MSHRASTDRVAIRRDVILADLRAHPLSSTREISDRLLAESGGSPSILTGAVWIAPWTVWSDLRALELQGRVCGWRDPSNTRSVAWQVLEASE